MAESTGFLSLRWNNHNNIFAKILDELRLNESYCDVSLSCGGQFFAAHKFVLSTCSDYFKEMFARTPCNHPIIYMRDVAPRDIEALLDFMYKGEVQVAETQVTSLLRTAEGLRVKGLAIPDDTSPGNSHQPTVTASTPAEPRASSSTPQNSFAKRKRQQESNSRKDEPPKLTPLPKNDSSFASTLRYPNMYPSLPSTSQQSNYANLPHLTSPPELKRFKRNSHPANKIGAVENATSPQKQTVKTALESQDIPISSNYSQDLLPNGTISASESPSKIVQNPEDPEDHSTCSSEDGASTLQGKNATEINDTVDAEDRRPDDGEYPSSSRQSPSSSFIKEEPFQNNGSLDNDDETNAVLQVDLSEDGTQFIIGPGGQAIPTDRDDSIDEDTGDGQKKPFVCPLCGHDFTRRDNLANHLKTHTGDRPYMCQYCHKCFSRKDYLKQHERIHTGEKPYQCPQCDRAFTRKEGMTDHMRCHSDFKEFACEVCSKSFKQKCGLRFHKRNYKH